MSEALHRARRSKPAVGQTGERAGSLFPLVTWLHESLYGRIYFKKAQEQPSVVNRVSRHIAPC